jgi:hypothetical protein
MFANIPDDAKFGQGPVKSDYLLTLHAYNDQTRDKSAPFPANATAYNITSERYSHKKRDPVPPLIKDESDQSSFVTSVNHNNILPLSVQTHHSSSTTKLTLLRNRVAQTNA